VTVAIQFTGLSKKFGQVQAVDSVSLSLSKGRFLALLGPSGCGKTTTLRLLAGFDPADAGTIDIGEQRVFGPDRFVPPEKRSIGMVFQEYALFPHLSVTDNVAYGIPRGVDKKQRVGEVLELVGLTDMGNRLPYELSGGQQQRVALARALAPGPQLILLDEPFSNLDSGLRTQLRVEVRQILRQAGATVIFVTHDQEEALSLADEIAVMMNGQIVQTASPWELYHRPVNPQVAAFLGNTNFLPGIIENGMVNCDVGQFPAETSTVKNNVTVMLRPEIIKLHPANGGTAEITSLEYFGHDQLLSVRLNSGTLLNCRLLGSEGHFQPGQRVNIAVNPDEVVIYPGVPERP
jgi:iron(III) transport system ATP-binding protein